VNHGTVYKLQGIIIALNYLQNIISKFDYSCYITSFLCTLLFEFNKYIFKLSNLYILSLRWISKNRIRGSY
jgi:hypothetical protein